MKQRILLFIILLTVLFSWSGFAQRGVRIGYIDMEVILKNVTDYQLSKGLLEKQVDEWKQQIELKKIELKRQEDEFLAEKTLLTPELISDREEELEAFALEIVQLQRKRFGSRGDYIRQKENLLKPIQDRVLTIVQEIAIARKYDFVFDRTSDLVMLYSAKKHDISELVLRKINSQERRIQKKKDLEGRKKKIEEKKQNNK